MKNLLTIIFLFLALISNAQVIIKVQDGTFIKLSGGSQIIVSNPSVNPIRKTGNSGGIWTPSENEKIVVDVSNSTGQFNIPFVSSVGNTIPFDYTITTAGSSGGRILFSTYETGNDNLPYPTGVTNVGFNGVDNSDMVIDRFWSIDVINYTTKPKGTYTFTYDDNDLVGNTINEPSLFIQRWNDVNNLWGDWLYSPLTNPITNTIEIIISNPQDQYKVWTAVDQGQPLPIELVSFKTDCGSNKIEWLTATETNNEWFILQGTNDAINFTNLDTIPGAGNSNQMLYYSVPILDWEYSYFRLQQIDFDGKSENSFIIAGCPQNGILEPILFPNPNNGQFIIKHNSTYTFEVFDMIGKRVWSERSNRINFDLNQLSDGKYFIRLTNQYDNVKTFKFVKIN
jgi:hypothetical protein